MAGSRSLVTAGGGSPGGRVASFVDGVGVLGTFSSPHNLAVDSSGNVFIADQTNNAIRNITAGNVVSTMVGAGPTNAGLVNGVGTAAKLSGPRGVALDGSSGTLYVADEANNVIRAISPALVVTTFAGSTNSFTDATGTNAAFSGPQGVAVDSSGNIYVADAGNNVIRKITAGGVVTTIAGGGSAGGRAQGFADGTGTNAKFTFPSQVALDGAGNLYIADRANHAIRRLVLSNNVVTTLAGGGSGTTGVLGFTDGQGTTARFNSPYGLAVDSTGNNIFVADTSNHAIRKVTAAGAVSTVAGGSSGLADGAATAATFWFPRGVAVDSVGNVFVADYQNNVIRKIVGA